MWKTLLLLKKTGCDYDIWSNIVKIIEKEEFSFKMKPAALGCYGYELEFKLTPITIPCSSLPRCRERMNLDERFAPVSKILRVNVHVLVNRNYVQMQRCYRYAWLAIIATALR